MVRIVRHALEHQRGRAVRERPVNDVAVSRNPADVGRAPVHIVFAQVEYGFVRKRCVDEIAARRVQHAFRFAGRARRVEDEQRVFRVHRFRRAFLGLAVDDVVVPAIAPIHRDGRAGALDDQHVLHGLRARRGQRLVHVRLERNALVAANAFVRRDHDGRGAIGNAAGERVGREAAEHDRVDGADARAREHRDCCLGNHRQVDRDAIAFLHAQAAQRVAEPADPVIQLAISDARRFIRVVAFVDERRLVAALRQVTIEAVVGNVQLAVVEPADAEVTRIETDILDLRVRLHPVEPSSHAAPERLRVIHRLGVRLLVILLAKSGLRGERCRHFVEWLAACVTPCPDCPRA